MPSVIWAAVANCGSSSSLGHQVVAIFAGTQGFLDDLPVEQIEDFEKQLIAFIDEKYPEVFHEIEKTKDLSDQIQETIKKAIEDFKKRFEFSDE